MLSTVPPEGGRPSSTPENENGTFGSVNNLTPAAGPERNWNPKLGPPNVRLPDEKLDACPVANPGSLGFWTTLVMTPLKSAPVRGGMLPKTNDPRSGSEPKKRPPESDKIGIVLPTCVSRLIVMDPTPNRSLNRIGDPVGLNGGLRHRHGT